LLAIASFVGGSGANTNFRIALFEFSITGALLGALAMFASIFVVNDAQLNSDNAQLFD
jgi:hypothetical protein